MSILRDDYRPIDTAPRDGTFVEVACPGEFGPFEMRWNPAGFNPIASLRPGLWETRGGGLTWSEDRGGGPTHWRPIRGAAQ